LAAVKADAYGHGAKQSSRVFLENGADRLGVATLSEGLELRLASVDAPILNLGYTPVDQYEILIRNHVSASIYNLNHARVLNETAERLGETAIIHVKITPVWDASASSPTATLFVL